MENKLYFIATKKGIGKKFEVSSSDYDEQEDFVSDPEKHIELEEGDSIVSCFPIDGGTPIFCANTKGVGFRFKPSDLRVMGKEVKGLPIIKLEEGDELLESFEIEEGEEIVFITYNDATVTVKAEEIPIMKRRSQGVKIVKIDEEDPLDDIQKK